MRLISFTVAVDVFLRCPLMLTKSPFVSWGAGSRTEEFRPRIDARSRIFQSPTAWPMAESTRRLAVVDSPLGRREAFSEARCRGRRLEPQIRAASDAAQLSPLPASASSWR